MKKNIIISLVLYCCLLLVGCVNNQDNLPKKHHLSNDDIAFDFTIKGTPKTVLNFEGKAEIVNNFDVYIYIEKKTDQKTAETIENIRYKVFTINDLNKLESEHSNNNNTLNNLPITQQLVYGNNIGGNGYKEIYGTIKYSLGTEKEIQFYEKIIPITDNVVKRDGYPTELDNDLINLAINLVEEKDRYHIIFNISFNVEPVHYDYQTYLVTSEGLVYPFLGKYNNFNNKSNEVVNNNYIYKDIMFEYLYFRMYFYNIDNEVIDIRYRMAINHLNHTKK